MTHHYKTKRRTFAVWERKDIWRIFNKKCNSCKKPISYEEMTIDHIIPLSKGGTSNKKNLQPLHQDCHIAKEKR